MSKKSDRLVYFSAEFIERRILLVRRQKVMLDRDLAELYGEETFNLNEAVKCNTDRFPVDFMFQLTKEEVESLTFQIGISKCSSILSIQRLAGAY